MSRNASGIYTLPSQYNPVVAKTTILKDWANTTLTDIASEITNSLDRSGRGAMTAPLQLPDGTAALPALTFSGDTDTGLYRSAANTLGFSTGGTQRGTWDSTALTISAALRAGDGSQGTPALSFSADTDTGIYRAGANDMRVVTNGQDRMSFTTKVGISAATAATGGTRQDALSLNNGDLDLSLVTAPTSTTGISNRLTPSNLLKAWVVFQLDATVNPFTTTVQAAFNVTSVARTSVSTFTITFASNFTGGTAYGPVGQVLNGLVGSDQIAFNPTTRNAGSLVAGLTKAGPTGGSVSLDTWGNIVQVMVAVYGLQ